jgi:hypothetical protein
MWNYDEQWVNTVMGPLFASRYKQVGRAIGDDAQYAAWPCRVLADIYQSGMDPAVSLAKHDRELCAALGIALPFPPAPSQATIRTGQITGQGLTVHTTKYGDMPWWPGCWPWLDAATRAEVAPQLIANGDEILLIDIPHGPALYDEAGQFYSPDKFGPLDMTRNFTAIDPAWVALVEEAIGTFGFKAVWIALPTDDNATTDPNGHHTGFNHGMALRPLLIQALASSLKADLNPYCAKLLMWDGVFYGFTPAELQEWFDSSYVVDPTSVYGMEHSTAHIPAGEAVSDWQPGGPMYHCSLLLGEFNSGQFDDTVWQILGRCLPPGTYKRPADQPSGDDPNPPYHLVNDCTYRVFEYGMYVAVRGTPNSVLLGWKAQFEAMGALNVC